MPTAMFRLSDEKTAVEARMSRDEIGAYLAREYAATDSLTSAVTRRLGSPQPELAMLTLAVVGLGHITIDPEEA